MHSRFRKSFRTRVIHLQEELCERFWNFESFNAWFVMIPWGSGFIYCGLYDERMGYKYALVSAGIVIIVRALRNGTYNPIKYWNKVEELQERRKNRVS